MADGSLERQELRDGLVEAGAQLYETGQSLQNQLAELAAQNLGEGNPAYSRLAAQFRENQEAIDRLADEWKAKAKGTKVGFMDRIKRAARDGAENAQEALPSRESVVKKAREQVQSLALDVETIKNSLERQAHVAQLLVENGLNPLDLIEGDRQDEAAKVLGWDLPTAANLEGRTLVRDLVLPFYKDILEAKVQEAQNVEGLAGILGKPLSQLAKRVMGSPSLMLLFAASVPVMYSFWKNSQSDSKGKLWEGLKWLTVAGVAGVGVYELYPPARAFLDKHLKDPTKIPVQEVVAKFQDKFHPFAQNDYQALRDFGCVVNMDMGVLTDAFRKGSRSIPRTLDVAMLQANGLDASATVDGTLLYNKMLKPIYGDLLYKRAVEMGEAPETKDEDERCQIGASHVEKHFPGDKLVTVLLVLMKEKAAAIADKKTNKAPAALGTAPSKEEMVLGKEGLPEKALADLVLKAQLPSGTVRFLKDDIYLVEGYPYHVHYDGTNLYFDGLRGSQRKVNINAKEGVTVLKALVSQAAEDAKEELEAFGAPEDLAAWRNSDAAAEFHYSSSGVWEMLPPPAVRFGAAPAGLSRTEEGKTVDAYFVFNGPALQLRVASLPKKTYEKLGDAQLAYEREIVFPELLRAQAGYVLLDLPFTVKDATSTTDSTVLTILYGANETGTFTFKNDLLVSVALAAKEATPLEEKWRGAAAENVRHFTENEEVQDLLNQVTRKFAKDQTGWGNIEEVWEDLKSYFINFANDKVETSYDAAFVRKVREVQGKMQDRLVKNVYGGNKTKIEFDRALAQEEKFFTDAIRAMLTERGHSVLDTEEKTAQDTVGVTSVEVHYSKENGEYEKARAKADAKVEAALWKCYTGKIWMPDLTDRALVQGKISRVVRGLNQDLDKISDPTNLNMDAVLRTYLNAAIRESGNYYGMDTRDAARQLLVSRLDESERKYWEKPTMEVMDYLMYKLKWEQYGIFPSPENMTKIIDLWFEKIEQGKATFSKDSQDGWKYAELFISYVDTYLGGHKDWSPDRLMEGDVYCVSGTAFDSAIGEMRSNIPSVYWWKGKKETYAVPKPDVLKSFDELYKDRARVEFWEWFDTKIDVDSWNPTEGNWPEVFRDDVDFRFNTIVETANNSKELSEALTRFSGYVLIEKALYQTLIDQAQTPEHNRENTLKSLKDAWDACWPNQKTAEEYATSLQTELTKNGVPNTGYWSTTPLMNFLGTASNFITDLTP